MHMLVLTGRVYGSITAKEGDVVGEVVLGMLCLVASKDETVSLMHFTHVTLDGNIIGGEITSFL
jgi:hypothetical protein